MHERIEILSHIRLWSPLLLRPERERPGHSRWGTPWCDWSSVLPPRTPCCSDWPRGCWGGGDPRGATLCGRPVRRKQGSPLWWRRWPSQVTPGAPQSWMYWALRTAVCRPLTMRIHFQSFINDYWCKKKSLVFCSDRISEAKGRKLCNNNCLYKVFFIWDVLLPGSPFLAPFTSATSMTITDTRVDIMTIKPVRKMHYSQITNSHGLSKTNICIAAPSPGDTLHCVRWAVDSW